MKKLLALATFVAGLGLTARAADTTVKISKVHLCCDSCVKGVDKAITSVSGATAKSDKDAGTVIITAPDHAAAQKAADALVAAGYYGKTDDATIKVKGKSGAKKAKVQSLKVHGVHLCCGKCVTAVNDALGKAVGVKGNTAAKGAESFEVTGDFSPKDVFSQLHKAGFAGKAGK